MSYNGWTNYETRNVKLWLDNEVLSYRYWKENAQMAWEESKEEAEDRKSGDPIFTRSEIARRNLADRLQSEVTDGNPLADAASMYSDLLGAALSDVNWSEIANSLLEDYGGPYESCDFPDVVA